MIYILYENEAWVTKLVNTLSAQNIPHTKWDLSQKTINLHQPPPHGIFLNKISASAHLRNNNHIPEFALNIIKWLESNNQILVNGSNSLQLELSKVNQYIALQHNNILTPKTYFSTSQKKLLEVAKEFASPFLIKPNRSGTGAGIKKCKDAKELAQYFKSKEHSKPVDGIYLIQEYIQSPTPTIKRLEFIGGKFLYALDVNTSDGFMRCPADACSLDDENPLFQIDTNYEHPIIEAYEQFLIENKIDIAGIEYIIDKNDNIYTYDVNTNTNYNAEAESMAGINGIQTLVNYLISIEESLLAEE